MSPIRALFTACCLFAFLLAGCGKGSNDSANVRVVNLISGASNVTVTVGGTPILTGGNFEAIGPYTGTGTGNQEFKVTVPGSTGALLDTVYGIGNTDYTYVTSGTPGAAAAVLVADPYGSPGGNTFAVRVLDMSANAPTIDLYLTAPGADLASATPVISAAVYLTVSSFVNTPSGTVEMRITTAGTKDVIYDATQTFGPGTGQTIVTYTRGSGSLVNAAIMASSTTGSIANSQLARLKAVNGTAVPAPLNILVDGNPFVSNLAFAGVAQYQTVAAGNRTVTVESSATPGATLLTVTPDLVPATDTSMALAGPAGAMTGLVLNDSNPPVSVGRAQLRVVNVSPDLAAVDVYANFGRIVSGLATNASSTYILVDAVIGGSPYRFDINAAGSTTVLLNVPGQTLGSGSVYTLYLLGSGGALSGVLTQDR